ncbi:MAG: sigma-70 family RNA polymerase sigma factor [Actinomycetia bacterium]|nr:sigma-70 family RNA polymerase sigma factor [Actinomycetes bacterium]
MTSLDQLASRAAAGDRWATEQFVRETQADVWRLCRWMGDLHAADDLTQETYLRALGSLSKYRGDGSARGWLMSIARRTCADHARRSVRRRRLDEKVEANADHNVEPSGGHWFEVEDLLLELDADRREAFVLTQLLGLRYDEAAQALAVPVGTIRSRVARARADLLPLIVEPGATGPAAGS